MMLGEMKSRPRSEIRLISKILWKILVTLSARAFEFWMYLSMIRAGASAREAY
jgi:hypothetical protein